MEKRPDKPKGMKTMKIEIKNRFTNKVIFSHDQDDNTITLTVEAAINAKVPLGYANLNYADLSYARLDGAIMYGADLCGADLHNADLHNANLCGANMHGATIKKDTETSTKLLHDLQEKVEYHKREYAYSAANDLISRQEYHRGAKIATLEAIEILKRHMVNRVA